MSEFESGENRAETSFEKVRASCKKDFLATDLAASNMASLRVGWGFFRRFALSKGVITKTEYSDYGKRVTDCLGDLMSKQKEIYSSNPGQLFIKGLRRALKDGKAHVLDSKSALQPDKIFPPKVGWDGNIPNGEFIGWRDAKTGEVFIRGELDVEVLINLLPKQDQSFFSNSKTKFWKDLKLQGALKCDPNADRNTTRISLAEAENSNNYHLNMAILRAPKSSKPTLKPEEKDSARKGKSGKKVKN